MWIYTNKPMEMNFPIKKYWKFENIKSRYLLDIDKVLDYYRNKDAVVNNGHVLSKLVNLLYTDLNIDLIDYYKHMDINSKYIAKQLDFTTNENRGKVIHNQIFGENSYDNIVTSNFGYNIEDFEDDDYINKHTVKVIHTTETDMNLKIPSRRNKYIIPQFNIIHIDIPAFMLQYRRWAMKRIATDNAINPNVFIYQVILPNLMVSSIDHIIYNRFSAIINGEYDDLNDFHNPHPFYISDYSPGLDKVLSEVYNDVNNSNKLIQGIYMSIPTIIHEDMMSALHIDKSFYTVQSLWSLYASRIPHVTDLVDKILDTSGIRNNRAFFNSVKIKIKEFKRNDTLSSYLPGYYDIIYDNDIETIYNILTKR